MQICIVSARIVWRLVKNASNLARPILSPKVRTDSIVISRYEPRVRTTNYKDYQFIYDFTHICPFKKYINYPCTKGLIDEATEEK